MTERQDSGNAGPARRLDRMELHLTTGKFDGRWIAEQVSYATDEHHRVAHVLFDAGAITIGISQRPAYKLGLSVDDTHRITVVLQGRMVTRIDGKDYQASGGQITVTPAGVPYTRKAPVPLYYAYITLADTEQWTVLKDIGPYVRDYASTSLFYLLIRGILDAKNTQSGLDQRLAVDHAVSLLRLLKHETLHAGRSASLHRAKMVSLLSAISMEPAHPWALAEMAGMMHLSAPHLSRIFREEFGESVMAAVTRIRMQDAMGKILKTSLSVGEIGRLVGYDSQFSFSRLFKKYAGISPSEYRKKHRKPPRPS